MKIKKIGVIYLEEKEETREANKIYSCMSAIIQLNTGTEASVITTAVEKYKGQGFLPDDMKLNTANAAEP